MKPPAPVTTTNPFFIPPEASLSLMEERELPAVTIVTPCLNSAPTLPATLESVRSQDYPKLEHVVVDGGSTDGTVEILEAAEGVRYVSEPDRGLSHAMNKGIAMARGDVVGWLNADDVYEPGALRAVGEAFAADPECRWVTGYCPIIDGEDREIRKPVTAYKNALLRRYSLPLLLTQNFVSCPATFVRKDAFEEAGEFDERYRNSMDYDMWLRIGRRHPPTVLRRDLARFRMVEGTLSMIGFERQFSEHMENARTHGDGHALAVRLNVAFSKAIVLVYRALRAVRRARSALAPG
jgi:glycosyltransferase involved in cell wall biosynthesis